MYGAKLNMLNLKGRLPRGDRPFLLIDFLGSVAFPCLFIL